MVRICSRKTWIYIVLCFLNMTTVLILYRTFTATSEASRANSIEVNKLSSIDADFMINQASQQLPLMDFKSHIINTTAYYKKYKTVMTLERKKQLLCSTFIKLTSSKLDEVLLNVVHSDNYCNWIIVVYSYEPDKKDALIQEFHQKLSQMKSILHNIRTSSSFLRRYKQVSVTIDIRLEFAPARHSLVQSVLELCATHIQRWTSSYGDINADTMDICASAGLRSDRLSFESKEYNGLIYPKSLLFLSLLPYLSSYQNVWLLDDDLSLVSFDMTSYLNIWKCSSGQSPLVAQPLIAENTQTYKYLNSNKWRYSQVLSSTTGFIEIQAPLVNSVYFEWFLVSFVMPLLRQSNVLGADWGFDSLFCPSAQYYLNSIDINNNNNNVVYNSDSVVHPCLLIVGSPPLHHNNNKITNNILGLDMKKKLNKDLMRIINSVFPDFVQIGKGPLSDPLHPEATGFQQFYTLNNDCSSE